MPADAHQCKRGPIAIDGPAASGKSTLGEALAARLGMAFLDTGLMYRAFTLAAIERGVPATDHEAFGTLAATVSITAEAAGTTRILVDGRDVTARLREPAVEGAVSSYSAIPAVREALVAQQRAAASGGAFIVAGRDIGTVVLPDAPVKLFLTASEETRAERRARQAAERGQSASLANIRQRDQIDTSRGVSPLRPASDAIVLDTTAMTFDEVLAAALRVLGCDGDS
jgi:cytidylate kinase